MHSHELLRQVFETTSAKQIAADMNVSVSLIYRWPRFRTQFPDSLLQSARPHRSADPIQPGRANHSLICQRAGGFFIRNPKTHHAHPDFLNSRDEPDRPGIRRPAGRDRQRCGGTITINELEAQTIRKRWEDLKSVTETFVHCCEEGNFRFVAQSADGRGKLTRA
jgi:hypothetical protein